MNGDYDRLTGIIALIREFDAGGELTAKDIAAKLGCSMRTAQRRLPIVETFVPIIQTKGYRYRKLDPRRDFEKPVPQVARVGSAEAALPNCPSCKLPAPGGVCVREHSPYGLYTKVLSR